MTRLHNYSREDLEREISLYTSYQDQLTADVVSVVMVRGDNPHVRLYVRNDRALRRTANNISDLADVDVADSHVETPTFRQPHHYYTSQDAPERWVILRHHGSGQCDILARHGALVSLDGSTRDAVAIYATQGQAEDQIRSLGLAGARAAKL